MPKKCGFEGCKYNCWGGGYCLSHQWYRKKIEAEAKGERAQPQRIKMYSDKRTKINREQYTPEMRKFLKERPFCEIRLKGVCTGKSEGVHHINGKATIALLLNKKGWLSSCNACNTEVEAKSKKAKELALKVPDYSCKLSHLNK